MNKQVISSIDVSGLTTKEAERVLEELHYKVYGKPLRSNFNKFLSRWELPILCICFLIWTIAIII